MVVVDQPVKRRSESGYVLLVALLLAGLVVATMATYARHSLVSWRQSTASLWVHETRESASSGVAYAKQVLASGGSCGQTSLAAGDETVHVDIEDLGGSQRSLRVDAVSGSLGSTVIGTATVYGLTGDVLPSITAAAAAAVAADATATRLSGTQTLTGKTYAGTLILGRGSNITLDDVVVKGCIVSDPALAGPPYDPVQATTLILRNGARIGPSAVLAGCGILLPDGSVTVQAGCSLEVHGAVLAATLDVRGDGSMDAQVMAARPFTLPAAIDRPGLLRTPLAWPSALTLTSFGLSRLSFAPQSASATQLKAISNFSFP